MRIKWLALPVLTVGMMVLGSSPSKSFAAAPQAGYGADHGDQGWDAPPPEYRDGQRQGFHEGIEAAHRDFDHHRKVDADDHSEYRHPHVDPSLRDDYREGFRHGYEVAMHHLMGQ